MRRMKRKPTRTETLRTASARAALAALVVALLAGCASTTRQNAAPTDPPATEPVTYFAGAAGGGYNGTSSGASLPYSDSNYLATYTLNESTSTFAQFTYSFSTGDEQGPQMNYSGQSSSLARGLLSLGISLSNGSYGDAAGNSTSKVTYNPPLGGNWAYELAGHAGGFVNLDGMPFVPMVNSEACPAISKSETYQFVTIPTYIGPSPGGGSIAGWDPQYDTAYGTVNLKTSGGTVNFTNIQQFNSAGTQISAYQDLPNTPPAVTSTSGACSPTFFGNTVSVPNPLTITDPGSEETVTPGAIAGIGPTGLLVESNGNLTGSGTTNTTGSASAPFQPFLGSGTGAMGLPQPSSAVDTGALSGAQYVGVIYGGGSGANDWTSLIASFGFPSQPATCPKGNFQTPLYGGDFPSNNPGAAAVQANGGYGNCDLVVDLGAQDSSNNGLFPHATVTFYKGFEGTTTRIPHSLPATAIAGQLNGKYAVFLIGVDTTGSPSQAWGIYLFQSN